MLSRLHLTIGRRIYLLIGLGFIGLLGLTLLDSRELATGLQQQKQIELRHLAELAVSFVKDEHDAAQRGEISTDEAQKRAQARIASCATAATSTSSSPTCRAKCSCIRSPSS